MPSLIYDSGPNGLAVFLFVTVALGGAAARATGQAMARTWRPIYHLVNYALLLSAASRFIQYALFSQPFVSAKSFITDAIVLGGIAAASYLHARKQQMAAQYPWVKP